MKKYMINFICIFVTVCIIDVVIEGIPFFGIPETEHITQVEITHAQFHETVTLTDTEDITLARNCIGFLKYTFGTVTDKTPVIMITYMDDTSKRHEIAANDTSVFYHGKIRRLKDDNTFIKIIEGCFFLDYAAEREKSDLCMTERIFAVL